MIKEQVILNKRVALVKGDKIRVSGGPYCITKTNKRISLAKKGTGTFLGYNEELTSIIIKFDKSVTSELVYVGPKRVLELTGHIHEPHKISKIRKSK